MDIRKWLTILAESDNPEDVIRFDVPLLIRMFEYMHEEDLSDVVLHVVTERLIRMSRDGRVLSMDDYDAIIGNVANKGQQRDTPQGG